MDRDALLDNWRRYKATRDSRHLIRVTATHEQSFVFRGPQWGHPSSYAALRFRCSPADRLSLDFAASWPGTVSADYRRALERAIACGVVDGILGAALLPSWVCALTVVEVGWDDLMSSEVAFYRAAKGAMGELIDNGPWQAPGAVGPSRQVIHGGA